MEQSWDVVGITVLTEQRQAARNLCREIREIQSRAFIVLGGAHPTLMTKQIVENWDCDAVVIGEGEVTITKLVHAVRHRLPLHTVNGIAYRGEEGRCIKTKPQAVVENLDELPLAAYQDFDLNSYRLFTVFSDASAFRDSRESVSIITSRGCTARCAFCSTFIVWRPGNNSPKGWRGRSAKHVVDEIEILYRDYGKRLFNIADDLFTLDEFRVIEICQEILRRKLNIFWDCETRVTNVSPNLLKWMKKAGCYSIAYGVESIDAQVLKNTRKGIHLTDIFNAFKCTHDAGIKSRAMLMIGNPGENEHSINNTCDFIKACKPDTVQTAVTMIFPGTALYHWARRHGFLNDDYWLTDKPAPYNEVEHSYRQLKRWESKILTTHAKGVEKILRKAQLAIENFTGLRISKTGIDIYQDGQLPIHLKLPLLSRNS
jgi:radical SAM superfamily enzyme YgiQ (UPF0313 family)